MRWQRLYNPLVSALLRSPLHRLLSGSTMLVSVRGRRSGRLYETPVNYVVEGERLMVLSAPSRTWWKNLRGGAPLRVLVARRWRDAWGAPLEHRDEILPRLTALLRERPALARLLRVPLATTGEPAPAALERLALERVVIVIEGIAGPLVGPPVAEGARRAVRDG